MEELYKRAYLSKEEYNNYELNVFEQKNLEQFLRNTAVKFVQQYT